MICEVVMDLRKSFLYESFIVDTESSGKPETTNKKKKKKSTKHKSSNYD